MDLLNDFIGIQSTLNLNISQLNGRHIDILSGFKPIMVIYSITLLMIEPIIITENIY
jgi:hypothetical protein